MAFVAACCILLAFSHAELACAVAKLLEVCPAISDHLRPSAAGLQSRCKPRLEWYHVVRLQSLVSVSDLQCMAYAAFLRKSDIELP